MSEGLRVDGLRLERAGRRVLDGVTFDLQPGEIVAVIGPNGAGKTSLLEALLGFLRLDAGSVHHRGRPMASFAARAQVFSYMPDDAEPPAEVAVAALLGYAERYGRPAAGLARRLREGLGLAPLEKARAGELSRGEKRRVGLYGALCTRRPVALLDEPLGAFDPLQLAEVLGVLSERAAAGLSLLITVHQLADAEKIASRLLLLDAGRVAAFGSLADLRGRVGLPSATLEEIFLRLLEERRARA